MTQEQCRIKIAQRLMEFMQVEKDCNTTIAGCFINCNIKNVTGETISPNHNVGGNGYYKFILSDGTSVAISGYLDSVSSSKKGYCIWFDIDGPQKGKGQVGIDVFADFILPDENRVGSIGLPTGVTNAADHCRDVNKPYITCSYWVLTYNNADYINCGGLTEDNPTCN